MAHVSSPHRTPGSLSSVRMIGGSALSGILAVAGLACLLGCPSDRVGTTTCLACHDGRSAPDKREFLEGLHQDVACEDCHGGGAAHVRNGGRGGLFITNPSRLPFDERVALCAECHEAKADGYLQTDHAESRAAVCDNCHDVHKRRGMPFDTVSVGRLNNADYTQLCGRCHSSEVSGFLDSAHAVLNAATCGACHDLHEAGTVTADPNNNDLCLQCHASFFLGLGTAAAVDTHTGAFHPVDPAGSGSSRCIGCHLPPLRQANQTEGPRDHTLFTVSPLSSNEAANAGVRPIPPNSCAGVAGCHDPNVPGSGAPHDVNDLDSNVALQLLYESIGTIPSIER